jgi:ABC-type bacteriocin/lantibiotic exporter with double-glycine peptidase domain
VLYKQARLLVLDEVTSSLDNNTEGEDIAAIEELDRGITVILIAHRSSTVMRSYRVVLLGRWMNFGCGSYQILEATNSCSNDWLRLTNLIKEIID